MSDDDQKWFADKQWVVDDLSASGNVIAEFIRDKNKPINDGIHEVRAKVKRTVETHNLTAKLTADQIREAVELYGLSKEHNKIDELYAVALEELKPFQGIENPAEFMNAINAVKEELENAEAGTEFPRCVISRCLAIFPATEQKEIE